MDVVVRLETVLAAAELEPCDSSTELEIELDRPAGKELAVYE